MHKVAVILKIKAKTGNLFGKSEIYKKTRVAAAGEFYADPAVAARVPLRGMFPL